MGFVLANESLKSLYPNIELDTLPMSGSYTLWERSDQIDPDIRSIYKGESLLTGERVVGWTLKLSKTCMGVYQSFVKTFLAEDIL